jgi:hypothetical protein
MVKMTVVQNGWTGFLPANDTDDVAPVIPKNLVVTNGLHLCKVGVGHSFFLSAQRRKANQALRKLNRRWPQLVG